MNIYRWSSRALKRYSNGWVAAVADSEEEARTRILADFSKWYWDYYDWKTPEEAEDLLEFNEDFEQIVRDIAGQAIQSETLFIKGSE